MTYWQRLRLVSLLGLAGMLLVLLLAAARREAPSRPPPTNINFDF